MVMQGVSVVAVMVIRMMSCVFMMLDVQVMARVFAVVDMRAMTWLATR